LHALLTWLSGLPPALIYLVAGGMVFAETAVLVGMAAPGEISLLCVGFLAYDGTLRLPTAILLMSVAALCGDAVGYAAGRRSGARLRTGRLGVWVGGRRWERADRLFLRYGGRAVAVGRFVAFARTLTPRLAGIAGVPYRRVLPWNVLGVLGWVGGSVVAGYLAGGSYVRVADVFGRATGAVLLLVLVLLVLVVLGRFLGRHRDPVADFGLRVVRTWPLRRLERWYTGAFRRLTSRFGAGGAVTVNLTLGVLALLAIGVGLAWVIEHLVRQSGLPLVDPPVVHWMAAHRTPSVSHAARVTLSVLRGSFVVSAVAAVSIALNPRPRDWGSDLLGLLGTMGTFIPLLILAIASDWGRSTVPHALLANQVTVVTAGLGMLAWLIGRRTPWAVAVVGWVVAVGAVVLVTSASLYSGRGWPSEIAVSLLMGSLWVLVFVVAWHTRARLQTAPPADIPPADPGPDPGPAREPHSVAGPRPVPDQDAASAPHTTRTGTCR